MTCLTLHSVSGYLSGDFLPSVPYVFPVDTSLLTSVTTPIEPEVLPGEVN